jgi:hypothetical protein
LAGEQTQAQVTIRGTIFNMYRTRPLTAVSVMSTSGKFTTTDSNGNYMIIVRENDSLYFSYLGKATMKYPVHDMNVFNNFDLALHVDPTELKEVRISPKDYHMDSLQNRKDYAKIFDYKKPGLHINSPGQGLGVGLDLDAIINMFRFDKNRRTLAFQHRLVDEEHEKFIDHKFSGAVIKRITHISDERLPDFMVRYRPSYEFSKKATDYEMMDYIKLAYQQFTDEESIEYTPPKTPASADPGGTPPPAPPVQPTSPAH